MYVLRFMSKEEFEKYKKNSLLKNSTKHDGKTNSVGFCFLDAEEYTPEEAMHFLSGIATFDICAVFETNIKLNKTYGIYAKPIKTTGNVLTDLINLYSGYMDHFKANEYCITEYSRQTMKLIKYSEDIWSQWDPTECQSKLKWKEANNE